MAIQHDRRRVLAAAAALPWAGAAAATAPTAWAAPAASGPTPAGSGGPLAPPGAAPAPKRKSKPGALCFFSKHLGGMPPGAMAKALKAAGFTGVDLTVRGKGHVDPANVVAELPRVVDAIRSEGLEVPLITTNLLSAGDPTARPILATAGKLRIPFFKPGYYRYEYTDVREELKRFSVELRGLAALGKSAGVQIAYHNHSGGYVGASLWDTAQMLEGTDPKTAGYYLDLRHAVAEGAVGGWKTAVHLVAPRTKVVAVKDFHWEKSPEKGWAQRNCPLGEGMAPLTGAFEILAQYGFSGPISLHIEYDVGGGEGKMLEAAKRDLGVLKARLAEVHGST